MLRVQEYLTTAGNSFETLEKDFGITARYKDHLVKLSYDQIESPKMHPIVMECRGLVLNRYTYGVVGSCFTRFFNVGEAGGITGAFNWDNFTAWTKEDGSWISLFFDCHDHKWKVTTRNSFADMEIYDGGPLWSELVFELLAGREKDLPTDYTYIFELCTMHNKVVRAYKEPKLILLGVIYNGNQGEVADKYIDITANELGFDRPKQYNFSNFREIQEWLEENSKLDATFEGLVLKDDSGLRMKVKSATYISLHHLKGEGRNMYMPKYILPFVLNGESSELLAYFPEVEPRYNVVAEVFFDAIASTQGVWEDVKGITDQKEFAAAVKASKHKFPEVLFNMRTNRRDNAESEFRSARGDVGQDPTHNPTGVEIAQGRLFMKLVELADKEIRARGLR